jgi:hypothetical protein
LAAGATLAEGAILKLRTAIIFFIGQEEVDGVMPQSCGPGHYPKRTVLTYNSSILMKANA